MRISFPILPIFCLILFEGAKIASFTRVLAVRYFRKESPWGNEQAAYKPHCPPRLR
jgi:hypothetical protein